VLARELLRFSCCEKLVAETGDSLGTRGRRQSAEAAIRQRLVNN
jgi:hypothetical protein